MAKVYDRMAGLIKDVKTKYKSGTDAINLASTVVAKVVDLVSSKTLNSMESMGREVAKKYPLVIEHVKNYMGIMTAYNLLVAHSHTATYGRKIIVKLLKSTNKKPDLIKSKMKNLEFSFDNSLAQLDLIIKGLKHIDANQAFRTAKGRGQSDQDQGQDQDENYQVKSLKDVIRVLELLHKKIKSEYTTIKSTNNKIITHLATLDEQTSGAAEELPDVITVKIGGMDDFQVYVGGRQCEQNIISKDVWIGGVEKDLSGDIDEQYATMLLKKIASLFCITEGQITPENVLNALKGLGAMSDDDYVEKLSKDCDTDALLRKEIEYLQNGKLETFLDYYELQRTKYLPIMENETITKTVLDDDIEYQDALMSTSLKSSIMLASSKSSSSDQLGNIKSYLQTVLDGITAMDMEIVSHHSNRLFSELREISTEDEFQKKLDSLEAVKPPKHLYHRKQLKAKIAKHISQIGEGSNVESVTEKLGKKVSFSDDDILKNIVGVAKRLIDKEKALKPRIDQIERDMIYEAHNLQSAWELIEELMSPDNVVPCIRKGLAFFEALTTTDVLINLAQSMFETSTRKPLYLKRLTDIRTKLHNAYKNTSSALPPPDLYDCGFCVDEVKKIANQLYFVDVVN